MFYLQIIVGSLPSLFVSAVEFTIWYFMRKHQSRGTEERVNRLAETKKVLVFQVTLVFVFVEWVIWLIWAIGSFLTSIQNDRILALAYVSVIFINGIAFMKSGDIWKLARKLRRGRIHIREDGAWVSDSTLRRLK